jgi:hypothetical protein
LPLLDSGVHIFDGNRLLAWPVQHPLQFPDILGRGAYEDVPVFLKDEIDGVAGLQTQLLPYRLGDHRLAFAGKRRRGHGQPLKNFLQKSIFLDRSITKKIRNQAAGVEFLLPFLFGLEIQRSRSIN